MIDKVSVNEYKHHLRETHKEVSASQFSDQFEVHVTMIAPIKKYTIPYPLVKGFTHNIKVQNIDSQQVGNTSVKYYAEGSSDSIELTFYNPIKVTSTRANNPFEKALRGNALSKNIKSGLRDETQKIKDLANKYLTFSGEFGKISVAADAIGVINNAEKLIEEQIDNVSGKIWDTISLAEDQINGVVGEINGVVGEINGEINGLLGGIGAVPTVDLFGTIDSMADINLFTFKERLDLGSQESKEVQLIDYFTKANGVNFIPKNGTLLLPDEYYFHIEAYALNGYWQKYKVIDGYYLIDGEPSLTYGVDDSQMQEFSITFQKHRV